MTETRNTTSVEEDLARMDETIRTLEAEQVELENLPAPLTWDEIQAGATTQLEAREARRGILPTLITAAKIKRLELERRKVEREMTPFEERLTSAYEKQEKALAKLHKAQEELNHARGDWHDVNLRLEKKQRRTKQINAEIQKLKGEG